MGTGLGTARIVGRGAQLRALEDAFEAGARGETRAVLVCGEAGIGKSRLLREFGDRIVRGDSAHPVVYAVGNCVDVGGTGSLYAPIRRLLRRVRADVGDARFARAARTAGARAVLATLIPDAGAAADERAAPTVDQVADAVGATIEALSVDHHLVLAIEDLHWADIATADLLRILATTLQATHATVVMTLRSGELEAAHPIARVLAEMERSRTVSILELARLDAESSRELVDALRTGSAQAREELVRRGEGVPFYLEELAAVEDGVLPDGLSAIVRARYERLAAPGRAAVDTLAAGGERVGHALLAAAFGDELGELQDGLREAVASGVVRIEGDDYVFRHALLREAVLAGILPADRSRGHSRFAAGLQREVDAGRRDLAGACAQQWQAAGELGRAFAATALARADALSRAMFAAAARQGERLLELWPLVPDAEGRAGESIGMVATGVAWSWWSAGDPDRAVGAVAAGEALCAPDDILERGLLQHTAALAVAEGGRLDAYVSHARRAVSLLARVADDDVRAAAPLVLSLGLLAAAGVAGAADDDPADLIEAARAVAARTGDPEARARLLMVKGFLDVMAGRFEGALDNARAAVDLDVRLETRVNAAGSEVEALLRLRRYADAIETGRGRIAALTAAGLAPETTGTLLVWMAEAHAARGDADEAERLLRSVRRRAVGDAILAESAAVLGATVADWRDRGDSAAPGAREVLAPARTTDHLGRLAARAALHAESMLNAAMRASDARESAESVERAVAALGIVAEPTLLRMPGISAPLLAPASRAAAEARLLGSQNWAALDAAVRALADRQDPEGPEAPLRALIAAEQARGARAAASSPLWLAAASSGPAEGLAERHRAYARFRLAQALDREGRGDEAIAILHALVSDCPRRGVDLVGRWAADDLARRRAEPHGTSLSSLTARERDVLALLAEGLTNRQIGERLFISPKTVSVHVSALIAKLGAPNRTAAAAHYSSTGEHDRG